MSRKHRTNILLKLEGGDIEHPPHYRVKAQGDGQLYVIEPRSNEYIYISCAEFPHMVVGRLGGNYTAHILEGHDELKARLEANTDAAKEKALYFNLPNLLSTSTMNWMLNLYAFQIEQLADQELAEKSFPGLAVVVKLLTLFNHAVFTYKDFDFDETLLEANITDEVLKLDYHGSIKALLKTIITELMERREKTHDELESALEDIFPIGKNTTSVYMDGYDCHWSYANVISYESKVDVEVIKSNGLLLLNQPHTYNWVAAAKNHISVIEQIKYNIQHYSFKQGGEEIRLLSHDDLRWPD